jgi:serine phosphatase RsbU (regulator of sigma subunit)
VIAFDILRAEPDIATFCGQPSQLPMEEYILRLATLGQVPLSDVFEFNVEPLKLTHRRLTESQHALAESNATLERKLAQLESANLVLQQRTEALVSLQSISQTLVTLTNVDQVADRVCRYTHDLCGAERAIVYFLQPDSTAEVLAVSGWSAELLHQRLDAAQVMGAGGLAAASADPTPFTALPPGVVRLDSDNTLRAGLRVPLIAQHKVVGLMIVHTTHKTGFAPGKVAMLQAFANQAAMALQRAGLIESLHDKIAQLEAAQAELVKKGKLEQELELARQVQQRLLPRIFPLVPGYAFAARCEPARQVGGDFYDVILLDANQFGIVIADVSDKGMPAALFMTLTRSLLLAEARRERSPRAVLTNVHRLLLALGQSNMFVTVFYGVIDASTGQMTYTRAGHDRPVLLRGDSAQLLRGEGAFIGILDVDELHLSEEEVSLQPGDRLVLYTDGMVDALAADSQPFGLGRLTQWLQTRAHLPADELCAATFAELTAYQGAADQYDDMTMLVVELFAARRCASGAE